MNLNGAVSARQGIDCDCDILRSASPPPHARSLKRWPPTVTLNISSRLFQHEASTCKVGCGCLSQTSDSMNRLLVTLLLVAAMTATTPGQTTWIVDANQPPVPGWQATGISALLAANPSIASGDIIRVVGIQYNGSYQAYSDTPIVPGQAAEIWPITIPEGVTIQAFDASVPVFVAAGSGSAGATLFDIGGQASSTPTTFSTLNIAGGEVGISLDHTGGYTRSAVVHDCNFALNVVAVSAIATGAGSLSLLSTNCSIRPDNGMLNDISIGEGNPNIGFKLHAAPSSPASSAPSVSAKIFGLRVFPNMTLQPTQNALHPWNYQWSTDPDLADITGTRKASRVIDVYSTGAIAEYAGGTISPISHVLVDLQSCDFDGSLGNWDIGVYGSAEGNPEAPIARDYNAGYRIYMSGSKIYNFGLAGVYGTVIASRDSGTPTTATRPSARGSVSVGSGTEVSNTGPLSAHTLTNASFS